jgi:hypothetical protein
VTAILILNRDYWLDRPDRPKILQIQLVSSLLLKHTSEAFPRSWYTDMRIRPLGLYRQSLKLGFDPTYQ